MATAIDGFQQLVSGIDYTMYIVTAACGDARGGCLVGFSTQTSIHPPRMLICLSKVNATFRVATHAEVLAVHFLGQGDLGLAHLFGEETGDKVDKFSRCQWTEGPQGVPILRECKGWMVGAIVDRFDAGDHGGHLLEPFATEVHRPAEPPLSFQQLRDLAPGHLL